MLEKIIWLCILHQIGDFVLQNDWLAKNKGNPYLMLVHAMIYVSLFLLFFGPLSWRHLVLVISHYVIDTAKVKNLISFAVDQILHYIIILIFLI